MTRRLPLYLALACTLALGLFLALPDAAQAGCNGFCETVAPGCQECVIKPDPTGARCAQQAPCFCIYKECSLAAQSSADVFTAPGTVPEFLQREPAMTEQTPPEEGACDSIAFLARQPAAPAAD